jgi:hypothetical protein
MGTEGVVGVRNPEQMKTLGLFLFPIVGLVGLALWGVLSDPQNDFSPFSETNTFSALQTPGVGGGEGVRQPDGSLLLDAGGLSLICGTFNNPDDYWGGMEPRATWDSTLPTFRTGIDILNGIGAPGIDPGPYYILIGDQVVDIQEDLQGWSPHANGKKVCVQVGQ